MRVMKKEKLFMKFQNIQFVKTVVRSDDLPDFFDIPEIAVVGRSNVGKSSLLNHLFGSKNLVKTSSTPGKTRALNFFSVDGNWICVDMPGYGYAAVSKSETKKWAELIETYLNNRLSLKVLLLLFDIRRAPSPEDFQMIEWVKHRKIPAILVLTKVDKVSKSEKSSQTKRITHMIKGLPYVHYSATKNEGRKELIALLRSCLNRPLA
jgi:GTP-binding protein